MLAFFASLYAWHYFDKKAAIDKAVTDVYTAATQAALVQSEAARKKEKALNLTVNKIRSEYANQKAINDDLVRNNANRLRDYESALASAASGNTAPASGVDDPYRTIANQCARALILLDEHAQGLQAKARALQDYANGLRLDTK
jgi:hypothetical protein